MLQSFFQLIEQFFALDVGFQHDFLNFSIRFGLFIAIAALSRLFTSLVLRFITQALQRLSPEYLGKVWTELLTAHPATCKTIVIFTFLGLDLNILKPYPALFEAINFLICLGFYTSATWFLAQLSKQLLRTYGLQVVKGISPEVEDLVLVCETIINGILGFTMAMMFAESQNLNLVGVLTGLGLSGLALAFAAKETLSQVIGSIVLYLDRPYFPGEYVRINFNPKDEDVYGRIESIGIRSTKIRVVAKNTLVIAPKSMMITKDIENISRGNKVMVLFYLEFPKLLQPGEDAVVKDTIITVISDLFGVDPLSTQVTLRYFPEETMSRAQVSFFLLSMGPNSLEIRKRLVQSANDTIHKKLMEYNLSFMLQDDLLYVQSPVTR